jgi:hypothetical protein
MTKEQQLRSTIRRHKLWSEAIPSGYRLNASCAWDSLDAKSGFYTDGTGTKQDLYYNRDPDSGDPCTVTIENGNVHWRWQWSQGYDEHLVFETVREWYRFFRHFMANGINDTDYADFRCDVC